MRSRRGIISDVRTAGALCIGVGLSVVWSVSGCSASSSSDSGGNSSGGTGATTAGVWANINVKMDMTVATPDAALSAFAKDSPAIADLAEVTAESGDCKLYRSLTSFCDPACDASTQVCALDGTCKNKQLAVGMGTLHFEGINLASGAGSSFDIAPTSTFTYQAAGANDIAYPPCALGSKLRVTGGAATNTPFSLEISCIEPLTLPSKDAVPFESGKVATLAWTPQSAQTDSRLSIKIDISHHGGTKGYILCDTSDDGSLEIATDLVTGLIELGTAGYPYAQLTRISKATAAAGSGEATFSIQSYVELELSIPGVVSCQSNTDCPTGQTCGSSKKCQ
jgi:hypothetical protein